MPTSRRSFLRSSSALATAVTFPNLMLARKGFAQGPVRVGSGEYEYECHHDWGTLPEGHHYGEASHGVALDKAGNVYITHHGGPGSVFVFDPEGRFVRAIGQIHEGLGHGIEIREESGTEFLYLSSDSDRGFAKLTLTGEVVWQKNVPFESGVYDRQKPKYRNTNISFCPDGGFHVGDGYGSSYIHRYDRDGNYIDTFGGQGSEPGKFSTPHGQVLDDRDGTPKILVADRANKRLQHLTLDGQFLDSIDGFLYPADIDIGPNGELLVPDLHCRITILDRNNRVVAQLGDDEEWRARALDGFRMRGQRDQWQPGKFVHPHDAKFDAHGNIYVAEWVRTGRVTFLKKISA